MRMQIHAMHADGTVTLWWEKPEQASGKETFTVTYGDTQLQTEKTHCTLKELPEETVCRFSVFMGDELLGETTVKTGKRLRKISVTDFGAVGDGKTMNTQAMQKAIDACGPDACVMIPEGVYLTGALHLHSDMALCVGKGAVLKGSEESIHLCDYPVADESLIDPELEKEISDALAASDGISRAAVYSFIHRCIEQGAIQRVEPGFVCRALIDQEDVRTTETRRFIDRLFGGSSDRLLATLVGADRLSSSDYDELRRVVAERYGAAATDAPVRGGDGGKAAS